MNYKDITELIGDLQREIWQLEELYVENGGEVTEETENQEAAVEGIRELLNTEGVDALGEWLKSLEDKKAELKAQKDYVSRKIKANDNSIEFVKATIRRVLDATETDKVKGSLGYSFARYESTKKDVLQEYLDEHFLPMVIDAVREVGLPACIDVQLKTNATRLQEGGLQEYILTVTNPTIRFTKPRASKKED